MGRRLPDAASGIPDQWRWPLTKKMGTPPDPSKWPHRRGRDQVVDAPPFAAEVTRRR